MASRVTIKDYLFESRLFMQRSVQALVFAALLLSVLVGRLVHLQVVAHEHYITLSDDNRIKILPKALHIDHEILDHGHIAQGRDRNFRKFR